jgi:hypothetical protein
MSVTPAEEARISMISGGMLPVGGGLGTAPFAQTFDRRLVNSITFAPTTQILTLTGIWLPAGQVVTGITFVSGATAESGGSHLWYALYQANLTFMAQSADDTGATSFAANTALRKALTAPQTCPYTGLYYLGFCCVGTIPTLYNLANTGINANGSITGMTPILAATSTGSLTATAPSPAGALTAIVNALYSFVD